MEKVDITAGTPREDLMLAFDDSPCWAGGWSAPDPVVAMWAQSAVARTVRALPELHPLRLGDEKGTSGRVLVWCATPDDADGKAEAGLGVLTQLSPPPQLGVDPGDEDNGPLFSGSDFIADVVAEALTPLASGSTTSQHTSRVYQAPDPSVRRWAGALAQIRGAWLPPVAVLARAERDIDDPATRWSTESLDFAERHTVHADDLRVAADLLAPHVTALILDHVPDGAALTLSGDALHIWWNYDAETRFDEAKVGTAVETAADIAAALPSFVLADYPDHSQQVEDRLTARAAEAAAYRAARDARLEALRERR